MASISMVPMNFLRGSGRPADYVVCGTWGKTALSEAKGQGKVRVAWDGAATSFSRMPESKELDLDPDAAYVHVTSNETIQGIQMAAEPEVGAVPLVCDASSDFLSRPVAMDRYAILYACAQKNAGPAGVTVVIIRDDMIERVPGDLPSMLDYRVLAEGKSLLNTPPTLAIYVLKLVTDWLLRDIGGLEAMAEINRRKAAMLYEALDHSEGFYQGHAEPSSRSAMNVAFRLADPSLDEPFIKGAAEWGLKELKGHRSVGGCRASIYNAMPVEGVELLRDYMLQFAENHRAAK